MNANAKIESIEPPKLEDFFIFLEKFKNTIDCLLEEYIEFLEIIEKEKKTIHKYNDNQLMDIIKEKTDASARIEAVIMLLMEQSVLISNWVYSSKNLTSQSENTLSQTFDNLLTLHDRFYSSDLRIFPKITQIKVSLDKLLHTKESTTKEIELNAYLLQQLVLRQVSIISLWKSELYQSEQTYKPKGIKKNSSRNTSVRAKA